MASAAPPNARGGARALGPGREARGAVLAGVHPAQRQPVDARAEPGSTAGSSVSAAARTNAPRP